MKRKILAVLLATLLSAAVAQAADDAKNIAGYGKTVWGMTPDQVVNAETPRAEKLGTPAKFKNGLGIVEIKEIQIGVTKFSAMFIFDESGSKLQQVNLTSAEKKNAQINAFSFSSIDKLLTEKYGHPTYKGGRTISWTLPKTSIELQHLFIPGLVSQVTVTYRPAAASGDAAKDL